MLSDIYKLFKTFIDSDTSHQFMNELKFTSLTF